MNLSDLQRFSLEADIHPTGGISTTLFVLAGTKVDLGSQRQLDVINVVGEGKTEEEATANGTSFALEILESLSEKADIIKVGTRELIGSDDGSFNAKVQIGLFDRAEEGADLVKKKGFGFGSGKSMKAAQEAAIESALRLIGEA